MKTLIIYDSLYGNTQKIAEAIGLALKLSSDNIIYVKDAKVDDIKKINLLVIGSPTHGGSYTESFKKLFSKIKEGELAGIKAIAFSTASSKVGENWFVKMIINIFGYATDKIASELTKKGSQIVDKKTFFVKGKEGPLKKGELERANKWASQIYKLAK